MIKNKRNDTINIFLISPIGKTGTPTYEKFKDSLEYIIKPALLNSEYNLKLTRADEIQKTGSIITDIVTQIATSFIVIADLTDLNPNVFYELGVRHALSPRTILISQSEEFIPFDLKDYRTIIYDTSAKGAKLFSESLNAFIKEIFESPEHLDNPVLEKLPKIHRQSISLEKQEFEKIPMSKVSEKRNKEKKNTIENRLKRLLRIDGIEPQSTIGHQEILFADQKIEKKIPGSEGSFALHWRLNEDKKTISNYYYISISEYLLNWDDLRTDIRMLIAETSDFPCLIEFIIVSGNSVPSSSKENIKINFNKLLSKVPAHRRRFYKLEHWDEKYLKKWEKQEGIVD